MPINRSENKVRVTKLFGAGATVGWCDPKVGMTTDRGPVLALDAGNGQITVGVGSGNTAQKFYPHQLNISHANATGVGDAWSAAFPTGVGCVAFGRTTAVPIGIGSGMAYVKGDGSVRVYS